MAQSLRPPPKLAVVLAACGVVVLLAHKSHQPDWLGRYSTSYVALVVGYLALAAAFLRAGETPPREARDSWPRQVLEILPYAICAWLPLLAADLGGLGAFTTTVLDPVVRRAALLTGAGAFGLCSLAVGAALVFTRVVPKRFREREDVGPLHVAVFLLTLGLWAMLPPAGLLTTAASSVLLSATAVSSWLLLSPASLAPMGWVVGAAAGIALWTQGTTRSALVGLAGPRLTLACLSAVALAVLVLGRSRGAGTRWMWATVAGLTAIVAVVVNAGQTPRASARMAAAASSGAGNVIVIVVDSLRADHLQPWGYARATSPFLQTMAQDPRTTTFLEAAPAATWTIPSIKAVFSLSPDRDEHWEEPSQRPPLAAWTLAEAFASGGYETAGISANPLIAGPGFEQGFSHYEALNWYREATRSACLGALFRLPDTVAAIDFAERHRVDKVDGDFVVNRALEWLSRRRRAEGAPPFFLYLHLVDPHYPYHDSGFGFARAAAFGGRPVPTSLALRHTPGDASLSWMKGSPELLELVARYDEGIRAADQAVSGLMTGLGDLGLDRDTTVVLIGDHGEEFLEHQGLLHGQDVYPELSHVPFLIRWASRPELEGLGGRVATPVSVRDLPYTLADFMRLPPAPGEGVRSRSLRAAMGASPVGRPVAVEAYRAGRGIFGYREGATCVRMVGSPSAGSRTDVDVTVFDARTGSAEPASESSSSSHRLLVERAWAFVQPRWREWAAARRKPGDASAPADDAVERLKGLGYLE
jgi:arylsulfatase A-like enzyme